MSQRNGPVPTTDIYATEPGRDNHRHPPNANEAPEGESNFSDGSEPLFSMYLQRAEEEDQMMAESWKGDAEGILLFTGTFSAVVATLLQVSIPTLQSSLSNIPSIPLTSAVWVNLLWFLSLVTSLTCALLATLLQQWTRRYLRRTRCSPHKRARIRAFYAEGIERLHLPWAVEALPTLLHISLFLFFAGLGVYLFGFHKTILTVVVAWIGLCIFVYASVTAPPIIHKDSPYHAPLSTFIWFCINSVRYAGSYVTGDPEDDRRRGVFTHDLVKSAEEHASGLSPEIDYRALSWTFDSLDQDCELEKFFEGVPGFCTSSVVVNPAEGLNKAFCRKLSDALIGLMDRTLSSSLVRESAKQRRITICTKAISTASLFEPWWILPRVLLSTWQSSLRSIDFRIFSKGLGRVDRPITTYYAQYVFAVIISSVQALARDEHWIQLVTRQIGVPKSALRSYLTRGDSILLANLLHLVRQTLTTAPARLLQAVKRASSDRADGLVPSHSESFFGHSQAHPGGLDRFALRHGRPPDGIVTPTRVLSPKRPFFIHTFSTIIHMSEISIYYSRLRVNSLDSVYGR